MSQLQTATQPAVTVRSAVPTFLVADVSETARWYSEKLGFRVVGAVPKREPYVYASVMRGGAELMLLALAGHAGAEPPARVGGSWNAYIRADGIGALWEAVKDEPFVRTPLTHQPYGDWEFEVRDPNGYVLVFGGAH
jgi:catechol 2,3-dioxygenase-like lactoylglutathione lyase family enzyme